MKITLKLTEAEVERIMHLEDGWLVNEETFIGELIDKIKNGITKNTERKA